MEIPKQLLWHEFRFIRIAMDGPAARKRPLDTDWQNTNNFEYHDVNLLNWLRDNRNYGIVCGYGNLAVIDADTEEIAFLVENRLPKTFTIKTGSGGRHYYYIIPDLEKKIVLKDADNKHYGEVQWRGSQVIGPGSIHPNGTPYRVLSDSPIATISAQHIKEVFGKYIKPEREIRPSTQTSFKWIDMGKIIDLSKMRRVGNEYQGSHPVHGSTTGMNFSVNMDKSLWHCFRCGSGGGPVALIAVLEGFITCDEAKGGAINNDIYQKVVQIAKEKYGVVITDE